MYLDKKLESLEFIDKIFVNVHYKRSEVYAMMKILALIKKVNLVDEQDSNWDRRFNKKYAVAELG